MKKKFLVWFPKNCLRERNSKSYDYSLSCRIIKGIYAVIITNSMEVVDPPSMKVIILVYVCSICYFFLKTLQVFLCVHK